MCNLYVCVCARAHHMEMFYIFSVDVVDFCTISVDSVRDVEVHKLLFVPIYVRRDKNSEARQLMLNDSTAERKKPPLLRRAAVHSLTQPNCKSIVQFMNYLGSTFAARI